MSDREKLIELLDGHYYDEWYGNEEIADRILADGWIRLPCKVGDTVYRINEGDYYSDWKPFVQELTVTEISWKFARSGKDLSFAIIANGIRYKFSSIGKTVFLTHEEAEAALRKENK